MSETAPQAPPGRLRAAREVARHLYLLGNEPPADLRPALAASFSRDQRRHADRTSIALENLRFGFVADVEPVHLAPMTGRRTLMRVMVSDDGLTTAGTYALQARAEHAVVRVVLTVTGLLPRVRVLDLGTTFDDGHVVVTTDARGTQPEYDLPACVSMEIHPQSTSPAALVARHAERVAARRRAAPTARPLVVRDLPTFSRLWSARSAVTNTHRHALGYVTDAELRTLLGKHHDAVGPLVRRELAALMAADAHA